METVLSGGSTGGSEVFGQEATSSGGSACEDTVASGGTLNDSGVASGTIISKGGLEVVASGGVSDMSQVYGKEIVFSGGSSYADKVQGGGVLTILSGGSVADGLTVSGRTASISGAVAGGQEFRFVS
jgi:autotransporter passenger strand-loop-strand repeat protein